MFKASNQCCWHTVWRSEYFLLSSPHSTTKIKAVWIFTRSVFFLTNEDILFICVARTTCTHGTIYKREQSMLLPLHARPLPSPRKNGLTVDNKPLQFLLCPQEREGGPERALCGNFPRKEVCDFATSSLEITRTETGMGLTQDWRNFKNHLPDKVIRSCASPLFEK